MLTLDDISRSLTANWPVWFVTITLVVAAVIDGLKLKVPNWITFPMIISGWIYSATLSPFAGWEGLMFSLVGTAVGLGLLLPLYAIGGMGAGDVKLLAGVGAWVWGTATLYAFVVSAIVGGVIAVIISVESAEAYSNTEINWNNYC
jgi:prepilin peptidase CpaA